MYVPSLFRSIPARLDAVNLPSNKEEVHFANAIRRSFLMKASGGMPYMVDITRAFRLLAGAGSYLEVGTRDKGNLAWISSILAPDALLMDIDIEEHPQQEKKLRDFLPAGQTLLTYCGGSVSENAISWLEEKLDGRKLDGVFLDSSHMYSHILREFDLYMPFLKDDGVLFSHDLYWAGNPEEKGKAQAFAQLDRYVPVYAVWMDQPVHRFLPRAKNSDAWGGVAVIFKRDYLAASRRSAE
jgi:hypothetical protein